jgi:hypothetical protein
MPQVLLPVTKRLKDRNKCTKLSASILRTSNRPNALLGDCEKEYSRFGSVLETDLHLKKISDLFG